MTDIRKKCRLLRKVSHVVFKDYERELLKIALKEYKDSPENSMPFLCDCLAKIIVIPSQTIVIDIMSDMMPPDIREKFLRICQHRISVFCQQSPDEVNRHNKEAFSLSMLSADLIDHSSETLRKQSKGKMTTVNGQNHSDYFNSSLLNRESYFSNPALSTLKEEADEDISLEKSLRNAPNSIDTFNHNLKATDSLDMFNLLQSRDESLDNYSLTGDAGHSLASPASLFGDKHEENSRRHASYSKLPVDSPRKILYNKVADSLKKHKQGESKMTSKAANYRIGKEERHVSVDCLISVAISPSPTNPSISENEKESKQLKKTISERYEPPVSPIDRPRHLPLVSQSEQNIHHAVASFQPPISMFYPAKYCVYDKSSQHNVKINKANHKTKTVAATQAGYPLKNTSCQTDKAQRRQQQCQT